MATERRRWLGLGALPLFAAVLAAAEAPAVPPGSPTNLQVVSQVETSALLSWTPGAGTTKAFKIRKSTQQGVHPDPGLYPGGRSAAFTFTTDDGLIDNLVFDPIFASRGLKFTAFVIPGAAGIGTHMTWAETEFLFQQGHEVQSHTNGHESLIDDRALAVRYLGAASCTLRVKVDTLSTIIAGVGLDLHITLTDPSAQYLVDLAALLDADPDYEASLLYSNAKQFATQSNHLDQSNPGVEIGMGAPAETLTTARGVHDDAELRAQILDAELALETHLQTIDPTYTCRFLAYPNHAHTQWAMSTLNELGYTAVRSGTLGVRPFFSEASYVPGFASSYEVPLSFPRPNNAWDEATTRSTYQSRMASWKANGEWAVLLVHDEAESDSAHVDWTIDEISSDPAIWVAPFGEVADFLAGFYTDVGYTVDTTGVGTGWIHGLSPSETTWVVVTAYNSALEESGWSNEIAIPPSGPVSAPGGTAPGGKLLAAPNPFAAQTTIRFDVARGGPTAVEILDVRGARVLELDLGRLPAGAADVTWDGRGANGRRLAAGVYVYRLRTTDAVRTGKLVLLR